MGPAAGGLIYGIASNPVPVYCCSAIAYLTAFSLMGLVEVKKPDQPRPVPSVSMVLEGVRFIWRNKLILGSISLDLFAVLLGGAVALLPVYAREILRTGAMGLGVLRAAPGLGAVIMAMILAHHPLRRKAGVTMLWSICGFGLL